MRVSNVAVALPILLAVSCPASAEIRLLEVPVRYLIIPAGVGGEKTIAKGEDAFVFPLRWENAAILDSPLEIVAGDKRLTIQRGQALVETRLQFDDPSFASSAAFCTPRAADPMRKAGGLMLLGLVGQAIARGVTDGQYCLIDLNRDGSADHSVLVNEGTPDARTPRAIAPIAYTLTPNAVVSEGDSITILYRGGRGSFEFKVIQQGKARYFQTFTYNDRLGAHRLGQWLRGDKVAENSYRFAGPGFDFTTSKFDKARGTIKVRWPATSMPEVIPIPDDVKVRYGY